MNYGVLLLQALLEYWPETNYNVPVDEGGDQEWSGGMGSRANSPAGSYMETYVSDVIGVLKKQGRIQKF